MPVAHSSAPTPLQTKKWRRSMRLTPATTVMKVRTMGTKRPRMSALAPCFSKNAWVSSKYFFLMNRPSRS